MVKNLMKMKDLEGSGTPGGAKIVPRWPPNAPKFGQDELR